MNVIYITNRINTIPSPKTYRKCSREPSLCLIVCGKATHLCNISRIIAVRPKCIIKRKEILIFVSSVTLALLKLWRALTTANAWIMYNN